MSIAIRANQSGVDQAAAQKAAEKKGHQDVVKSVNAGGFLRKNDTQSQIEARRNNAKKQALKEQTEAMGTDPQEFLGYNCWQYCGYGGVKAVQSIRDE